MFGFHFESMRRGSQGVWLVLAVICAIYTAFAIAAGLGLAEAEKTRAIRPAFVAHALAGGLALIAGAMQFNPSIRARFPWVHRFGGRAYVLGVSVASIAGVASAVVFDVSVVARASFVLLGVVWFVSTLLAYRMILTGDVLRHREWMLRSFSLSLFFVAFSVWVPALSYSDLAKEAAYALAVTLSWVLNLVIAEAWIRQTRKLGDRSAKSTQSTVRPRSKSLTEKELSGISHL